ncbi:helix-turn-helix domain-containing protein [Opitutus terrae]|uniref:helix-turn-helix domain-containing protein n=1 Tax=Opitutus terrae TaxID=107709 RepID=UPI0005D12951
MTPTIIALTQRGWSQRRVARELGVDRETVKRYASAAKPATNPTAGSVPGPPSLCEPHRGFIAAALERGLSARH